MDNSLWFLMGFDFHTLSQLLAQESFLSTLSAAVVQMLPELIPFSKTEDFSQDHWVSRRTTYFEWWGKKNDGGGL